MFMFVVDSLRESRLRQQQSSGKAFGKDSA